MVSVTNNAILKYLDSSPDCHYRLVIERQGVISCRLLSFFESLLAKLGFGPAAFKNIVNFCHEHRSELTLNQAQKEKFLKKINDYNDSHFFPIKKINNIFCSFLDSTIQEDPKAKKQENTTAVASNITAKSSTVLSSPIVASERIEKYIKQGTFHTAVERLNYEEIGVIDIRFFEKIHRDRMATLEALSHQIVNLIAKKTNPQSLTALLIVYKKLKDSLVSNKEIAGDFPKELQDVMKKVDEYRDQNITQVEREIKELIRKKSFAEAYKKFKAISCDDLDSKRLLLTTLLESMVKYVKEEKNKRFSKAVKELMFTILVGPEVTSWIDKTFREQNQTFLDSLYDEINKGRFKINLAPIETKKAREPSDLEKELLGYLGKCKDQEAFSLLEENPNNHDLQLTALNGYFSRQRSWVLDSTNYNRHLQYTIEPFYDVWRMIPTEKQTEELLFMKEHTDNWVTKLRESSQEFNEHYQSREYKGLNGLGWMNRPAN